MNTLSVKKHEHNAAALLTSVCAAKPAHRPVPAASCIELAAMRSRLCKDADMGPPLCAGVAEYNALSTPQLTALQLQACSFSALHDFTAARQHVISDGQSQ
jgi:hypothetical protein